MTISIGFGPWEPDRPAKTNDATLRSVANAYPTKDGWRPVKAWEEVIPALAGEPKGGATFTSPSGLSSIIVGTATSLYRATTTGFVTLQTGYSLQGEGRWRFAQFGGLAIATNGFDAMQKIDLSDSSVSELGGDPPRFEMLAVVKDFLVGGVMNGSVMAFAWSAINNAEDWTFGQNQSDYNILPSGGRITGILSGEFGVILQRNRIVRMDYVGGNIVFTINEVSSNIGCVSVHTVAQWGRLGFFWSDQGPMMWDGSQVVPIGEEMVNRYLVDLYSRVDWPSISTAIDPINGVVKWAMPDQIVGYNWKLGRWFRTEYVSPIIFSGVTRDITIDETYPEGDDENIDGDGLPSFDDPAFLGGDPRLYVFNSDYRLGAFTGSNMAASWTLGDLELFRNRRADCRFVRPETDAVSGLTLTLGYKQRLGDALVSVSHTALMASGDMPVRVSGRYIRPTLAIEAGVDWSYCNGLEFFAKQGAAR